MRLLAQKSGAYPTDPAVAYDNDKVCEDWNDYINVFGGISFMPAEKQREGAMEAFKKVEKFIESIKPFLENKTSGFLFGDKLMSADFWVGNFYVSICLKPALYGEDVVNAFLQKYPWFVAYGKRYADENKEYLSKRPNCPA